MIERMISKLFGGLPVCGMGSLWEYFLGYRVTVNFFCRLEGPNDMLLKSVIGKFHDKKAPISYRDRNWPVRASTEMGIDVVNTVIGFLTAYLKCMSNADPLRGLT